MRWPLRSIVLLACVALSLGCEKPSVLVVGLDGANWTVLEPLMDAGHIPTIERLVREGAHGEMNCVPAQPSFACFCPPVWTSIATGTPARDHRIFLFETPSYERGSTALWDLVHAAGGRSIVASWRGTWPPEPEIDFVLTEPGLDELGEELFDAWQPDIHIGRSMPDPLFTPPDLPELLGISPHVGDRPPTWAIYARDRAAMESLIRLNLALGRPEPWERTLELTMVTIHGPDKVEHLRWGSLQQEMFGPFDEALLLEDAEAHTGPVVLPGPFGWGSIAGQYLDVDRWLEILLQTRDYDYVVFVSDHGMTRNAKPTGFPGHHNEVSVEAHTGIFSVTGPGIVPGRLLHGVSVLDVAPTLAYLLGIPVAKDLPGAILIDAFTPAWIGDHPFEMVESWE